MLYKCVIKLSVHNSGVALSFLHTSHSHCYFHSSPNPSSLVFTSGPSSHPAPSFDVRVSFRLFHALSHTQRAFLRVWSGTKRLVVLALDLCRDVLCCDLLISDGKHPPQTHERSPLSLHLANSPDDVPMIKHKPVHSVTQISSALKMHRAATGSRHLNVMLIKTILCKLKTAFRAYFFLILTLQLSMKLSSILWVGRF